MDPLPVAYVLTKDEDEEECEGELFHGERRIVLEGIRKWVL